MKTSSWRTTADINASIRWKVITCKYIDNGEKNISSFCGGKFDQNLECCSLNMLNLSHRKSAHVTIVTLSWRVQNYVAIGGANFKPEHFKFWCHFEFDRNIVSGTGAWTMGYLLWVFVKQKYRLISVPHCNAFLEGGYKKRKCSS